MKPHLIAFIVFNVLEAWRRCKLMINLGIVKFFRKIIQRFLNYSEICKCPVRALPFWAIIFAFFIMFVYRVHTVLKSH